MFARRLSVFLVILTLCLIALGGVVHTQGASLACPDWPLCYGMVFPPMHGDILLEHGHRLLASAVGLFTLGLAIVSALPGQRRHLPWAMLGLALIVFQGALGGLTVLYQLPPPISIAHLATSMLFLGWAWRFYFVLSRPQVAVGPVVQEPASGMAAPTSVRAWLQAACAALFVQIVLGAAVRHTHSSMSCGTQFVLCLDALGPVSGPQWLQTAHRLMSLIVLVLIVFATVPVLRLARISGQTQVRALALSSHILVTLQVVLGALTLKTGVNLHVVVTHLVLAAVLWLVMLSLLMATGNDRPHRACEAVAGRPQRHDQTHVAPTLVG